MIKFTLTIWVCSFMVGTQCMSPMDFPTVYDSWKECSIAAHAESIKLIEGSESDFFNKYKVGMKYVCNPVVMY